MLGSSSKQHGGSILKSKNNPHYVGNEHRWVEILRSVYVSELESQIKFNVNKLIKGEVETNNNQ